MGRPTLFTTFALASIVLFFAGCSATRMPPPGTQLTVPGPKPENDLASNYKRSRPEAPPTPPFQEFGVVEGNRLTLRMNATLFDEQAREICDSKPYLVPSTWKVPNCAVEGRMGCDRYDLPPGQAQPPCLIPFGGACLRRSEPSPPPPQYDFRSDCYRTRPETSVVGQIEVYAVPDRTPKSDIVARGVRVGSVRLTPDGTPQAVQLPPIAIGQCFALADSSGQPIGLRGNNTGPGSHLFASAALTASRVNATLEEAVKAKEALVVRATEDLARFSRAVAASPAWKDKQCVMLPQDRLPDRPTVLSDSEMELHGKAHCYLLLRDQFEEDITDKGARAQQKYSFIKAAQTLKFDATRTAECTHRYSYSPRDMAYLRGEHMQYNAAQSPGLVGIIDGMLKGLGESIRVTQQQRFQMIGDMLEACYRETRSSCQAPMVSWEGMVADIKARPLRIKAQCESDQKQAREAYQAVQEAEKALAAAKAAVTAQRAVPSTQAVRLSEAVCRPQ